MSLELSKLSITLESLRAVYHSGRFTPGEVIREVYRRIRSRGDDHVWIHLVPESRAIAAAQEAMHQLSLPLAGIPFAVKDNIDVAGIPTTAGCPAFSYVPTESAEVVQRLVEAGAILIGKTNLDQFATGLSGTRSPYGACSSVYHPDYISGGSSSGSAVAVAAGLVAFALGTDTAGSGRVPAAFNNIVGLKPSRGIFSTRGVVPACRSLDCVSVFAQTCQDAEVLLDLMMGEDDADPYSRAFPDAPTFAVPHRFGIPKADQCEFFGDDEAAKLFQSAIGKLTALGWQPVEIDMTPFRKAADLLYSGPWVSERYASVGEFIKTHRDDCNPTVASVIMGGESLSASSLFQGMHALESFRKMTAGIWKSIDFLVVPTAPSIYRITEVLANPSAIQAQLGYYTNFVNLLDLAAIAVPMGFRPDGLPLGATFIAPAGSDWQLCSAACAYLGERIGPRPGAERIVPEASAVHLAVAGAHLSGFPLNHQLTDLGATLVGTVETAPDYAMFALSTTPPKPGLVRVGDNKGVSIELEIWALTNEAFGKFVAAIPPPMTIGSVRLSDGRIVKGFLCEETATRTAKSISAFGGWRNYCTGLTT